MKHHIIDKNTLICVKHFENLDDAVREIIKMNDGLPAYDNRIRYYLSVTHVQGTYGKFSHQ